MTTDQAPLVGIRVVDMTHYLAGPIAGRLLADLGAEVIKVESSEGDPARQVLPEVGGVSVYFTQHNAGKRCLCLDLRGEDDRQVLRGLLAKSDVLLENFRPGVMDRLGLGIEELMRQNPRLVCCSVSGYGQTGAWARRRAFAPLVHAETGILEMAARRRGQASDGEVMVRPEVHSHGDVYPALMAALSVLAALLDRERSGTGRRIDLSMAQALFYVNEWAAVEMAGGGEIRQLFGAWNSPILRLRSGDAVAFSGNPAFTFPRWADAMGRPDLLEDSRFATPSSRQEHRTELMALLQEFVGRFETVSEVEAVLEPHSLPVGRVRTVVEFADGKWAAERDLVAEPVAGVRIPRAPWQWDGAPIGLCGAVGAVGEDNEYVLKEILGLGADQPDAAGTGNSGGATTHARPRNHQT